MLGEVSLLTKSGSGKLVMCMRVAPGSVLGIPGIIGNEPYVVFIAHVGDASEVRFVTRTDFEKLLREQPALYRSLLAVLAADVRFARLALTEVLGRYNRGDRDSTLRLR